MKLGSPAEPDKDLMNDSQGHRDPEPDSSTDSPELAGQKTLDAADQHQSHEKSAEKQGMEPLPFKDELTSDC
jgi:hypothetical protein